MRRRDDQSTATAAYRCGAIYKWAEMSLCSVNKGAVGDGDDYLMTLTCERSSDLMAASLLRLYVESSLAKPPQSEVCERGCLVPLS